MLSSHCGNFVLDVVVAVIFIITGCESPETHMWCVGIGPQIVKLRVTQKYKKMTLKKPQRSARKTESVPRALYVFLKK